MRWLRRVLIASAVLVGAAGALVLRAYPSTGEWIEQQVHAWSAAAPPPAWTNMRSQNPEWDLMARTFFVLTLAERALTQPSEADVAVATMDKVLEATLAEESAHGQTWFLLPYAQRSTYLGTGRSLFVDGEIMVMLGARRMVRDDRWQEEMTSRSTQLIQNLGSASPVMLAESYPNEGWMFCHAMAMLGLRMHQILDGVSHEPLQDAWLKAIRAQLVHQPTQLLVSSFDMQGRWGDGPEGSSIWLVAMVLRVLDPEWAQQQYQGARHHLGREVLGLGYAREWPQAAPAVVDIDSGPMVPFLDASASSSGFALVASRAFGDHAWHASLKAALLAANVMMVVMPSLAQAADNPVGQAVVHWGLVTGPLWQRLAPITG